MTPSEKANKTFDLVLLNFDAKVHWKKQHVTVHRLDKQQ